MSYSATGTPPGTPAGSQECGNTVEERPDDARDLGLFGHHGAAGSEPKGRKWFFNDLDLGHGIFLFNEVEPALDVDEPCGRYPRLFRDLCPPQAQQVSDPARAHPGREHRGNIVQAEAQGTQGHNPVQPFKLGRIVGAVAAELIHVGGHEQAGGVPVPQHAVGYLADLRERSNG